MILLVLASREASGLSLDLGLSGYAASSGRSCWEVYEDELRALDGGEAQEELEELALKMCQSGVYVAPW